MSVINSINNKLNNYPHVKKCIKRCYQLLMVALSKKEKCVGNIYCVTPKDEYEYFFGYYDKSPWDISGRFMLCLKVKSTYKSVAPDEEAKIILIDTKDHNSITEIGTTRTWNVQQGCMLQWLGPDYKSRIIYNDYKDGHYCSVIKNVFNGKERIIDYPVYSVSSDGKFALTLDFSRLHRLRPGYGYFNLPDQYANHKLPDDYCIWKVDLEENIMIPLVKYIDLNTFEHRNEMDHAEHKVNHIMLSPDNQRFMVLHRWYKNGKKFTRLITMNIDGSDKYNLSDDDMVSHCCWKDNDFILGFENKKEEGPGYYLMKDRTKEYKRLWPKIDNDGHPSYSPNLKHVLIDSYPNGKRISSVRVMREDDDNGEILAKVYSPFKYDNDLRCDLHPRWSRDGRKICFDSVFEGKRRMYVCNLGDSYNG